MVFRVTAVLDFGLMAIDKEPLAIDILLCMEIGYRLLQIVSLTK